MGIKMFYLPLLVIFLVFTVSSRTWEDDSLIVRQILDTNELYSIPVDSVIGKKDSTGRVLTMGFGQPSFHILPAVIKNLDKLYAFGIDGTNIKTIPPEIGELKNLKILIITGNKELPSIPPEIGNLDSLLTLDISNNEITAIPPEIGNCKKIYAFEFIANKITRIPDEICDMVSLKRIDANSNLINYVPEDIGNMPVIHGIDLEWNKLKHVPNSLIPLSLDDVKLCFNDSLMFTEEQKAAWGFQSYQEYYDVACIVEADEDYTSLKQKSRSRVKITNSNILLQVNHNGHITCSVFNLSGRKIENLLNGMLSEGTHTISWNRDYYATGIYFVHYSIGNYSCIEKIIVK